MKLLKQLTRMAKAQKLRRRIYELKQQLAATDYKVIKHCEFSISSTCCYAYSQNEFDELHAERQAIRGEINRLEEMLKGL